MFVAIMSGIYIHRASNKYIILSLSLLLYTLYFFFSILFKAIPASNSDFRNQSNSYVIRMNHDWNSNAESKVINALTEVSLDNKLLSWEFRDKEVAWKKIKSDSSLDLFENPLDHYFVLRYEGKLTEKQFSDIRKAVDQIKMIEMMAPLPGIEIPSLTKLKNIQVILLPFMVFSFILFVSILHGAAQSNLSSNKRVIESLLLAGAHHSKLSAVFRRNAFLNFFFALVIALVLYLTTIYLIKVGFILEIDDFKTGIIIKSIILPTLVIFVLHSIILLWKVDKYLKSI